MLRRWAGQASREITWFRLRGRCVLLLLGRRLQVRDPDLVAAALLGGIKRLVCALHQAREQSRLIGGGDSDADRELQPAGEGGPRDFRPEAFGEGSRSSFGRLVKHNP